MPMDTPRPADWNELNVKVELDSPTPVASREEADRVLEVWDALMGAHWTHAHVQFVIYEGQTFYDVKAIYFGGPSILRFPTGKPLEVAAKEAEEWCVYQPATGAVWQCVPATKANAVAEAELAGKGHHRAMPLMQARELANAFSTGRQVGRTNARQVVGPMVLQELLDLCPTKAGTPAGDAHIRDGWGGLVKWYMNAIKAGRA